MPDSVRKAFTYKLKPTPEQVWQLERVVMMCRRLDTTALEQRITLWKQRGVTILGEPLHKMCKGHFRISSQLSSSSPTCQLQEQVYHDRQMLDG